MTADEVRTLLLTAGADLQGHWRLPSGKHTPRVFLCNNALEQPDLVERLAGGLAALTRSLNPQAVYTPSLTAATLGFAVARELGVPYFIPTQTEPPTLTPGARVLIVEDAVDSGSTLAAGRAWALAQDGLPVGAAAVVSRGAMEASIPGLPLFALLVEPTPSYGPDLCPLCAQGIAVLDVDRNRRESP